MLFHAPAHASANCLLPMQRPRSLPKHAAVFCALLRAEPDVSVWMNCRVLNKPHRLLEYKWNTVYPLSLTASYHVGTPVESPAGGPKGDGERVRREWSRPILFQSFRERWKESFR